MVSFITNYGMWGNSFNFWNTFDFLFILWGLKTLNTLNGLIVRSKYCVLLNSELGRAGGWLSG